MSEWIEWHGGECPVPHGTLVDVRYADGDELHGAPAMSPEWFTSVRGYGCGTENWRHGPADTTHIVAYRLAEIEPGRIYDVFPGHKLADVKPTNPKDALGSDKIPLHLWPETATVLGAMGLLDGASKYGRSNFRAIGVRASIYVDAAKRHLNKWFEGENDDPDSGLPHLAHALASIAIIVDAQAAGKLNDDRMVRGGYADLVAAMTPHVARLKALHADKAPKHFTISDNNEDVQP